MDQKEVISDIIESLEDLQEEDDASKLIKDRIGLMIEVLNEPIDASLRADRVQSILEELDADHTVPNYLRTQLWNVAAMLEML